MLSQNQLEGAPSITGIRSGNTGTQRTLERFHCMPVRRINTIEKLYRGNTRLVELEASGQLFTEKINWILQPITRARTAVHLKTIASQLAHPIGHRSPADSETLSDDPARNRLPRGEQPYQRRQFSFQKRSS
jgi:hypothetical protein